MSEQPSPSQVPAPAPAAQPERRASLPAAPPDQRITEIDKQRVPMAARPYRLLALVKQDAVVRVQKEPDDTVMTWPHLLSIEFFAAAMMSVFLILMGVFINAPLEELANGNVTPAVAKAPWYFVGLQELLAYFHPTVAGVLAPTGHPARLGAHPLHRSWTQGRRRSHAALGAQGRGDALHDLLGRRPHHHLPRCLLPRSGLRLDDAVGRLLLRTVGAAWATGS